MRNNTPLILGQIDLGDFAGNGLISTTDIDKGSLIKITQTTASIVLTLGVPSLGAGHLAKIQNTGTVSVSIAGVRVYPRRIVEFVYDGAAWSKTVAPYHRIEDSDDNTFLSVEEQANDNKILGSVNATPCLYIDATTNLSLFGRAAGQSNTGLNFSGFGVQTGQSNTGLNFSGFGIQTGRSNTGANFSGFGFQTGQSNTGANFSGFGAQTGRSSIGANFSGFGFQAGQSNTGANFSGFGVQTGRSNRGLDNTALGCFSLKHIPDPLFTYTIAPADVDFATGVITVSHGLGAVGTFVGLVIAATPGAEPGGFPSGSAKTFEVLSATTIRTTGLTSAGTTPFTLSATKLVNNATAVGFDAQPDRDNQVVLGDYRVTDLTTSAPNIKFGAVPDYTSGAAKTVVQGADGYLKTVATPIAHLHRITAADFPSIAVFNGNSYSAANGWVPQIMASSYTSPVSTYTGAGLNWRLNGAGNWELYGDVVGGLETWKIDVSFTRGATVSRFGTFN